MKEPEIWQVDQSDSDYPERLTTVLKNKTLGYSG